jgi:uncharacterized membrane protein
VTRRALPVLLVLAAAVSDSLARPGWAFYALLTAVPFAAVAALGAFGELLDRSGRAHENPLGVIQTLLWTVALGLIVSATSARAGVLDGAPASTFADPALLACVATLAVESLVAALGHARALVREPARPIRISEPTP